MLVSLEQMGAQVSLVRAPVDDRTTIFVRHSLLFTTSPTPGAHAGARAAQYHAMSSAFLVRFAQAHETFRQPELEALAELHHIRLSWLHYEQDVCT